MNKPAVLVLEDGTVFRGESIGADGQTVGEVVFNTAITGYQEILTDPSYSRQIVTLTYPHIGNVGTNPEDEESPAVYAAGLVIRDLPVVLSNWRSTSHLSGYLASRGVVAIAGIDTRRLTRVLREKGAQNGCILAGEGLDEAQALALGPWLPRPQGHGPGQGGHHADRLRVGGRHLGARAGAPRAAGRRADPPGGGLRLRGQAQHPADAGRPRLPRHRRAGQDAGGGRAGAAARRRVPVQRAGRPRALRLRDRGHPRDRRRPGRRCSASAWATSSWGWPAGRRR